MAPQRSTLATVIDRHPRFWVELVLWALCARRSLPDRDFHLLVYFIDEAPPDLAEWLGRQGIESRVTSPLVPASPHCNKIRPFLDAHPSDHVMVTDADVYFVADPAALVTRHAIQAAPNNHGNPPGIVFRKLLEAAGLGHAYKPGVSLMPNSAGGRETYRNNISAGVVGMPAAVTADFASLWLEKVRWLVDHRALLGAWGIHVDQVGFALAMAERDEEVLFLPPQMNIVLHLLPQLDTAYAFHLTSAHVPEFPARFLPGGELSDEGVSPPMKLSLGALNACIAHAREEILRLPSTRAHVEMFLNPAWRR